MSTLMEVESSNVVPGEEIVTTTARTRVQSSRALLKWDIQDFDVLVPNEAEMGIPKSEKDEFFLSFKPLRSPVFKTTYGQTERTQSEQKWWVELNINPKYETPNSETSISLFLHHQPSDNCRIEPSRVVMSFYVIGGGNIVLLKHSTGKNFENMKSSGRGFPKFVSLKKLWENRNTYLVNNTLRVRVEVAVFGSALTEITDTGFFGSVSSSGPKKLVDNMRQMFKSGKDADITISCGGKEFPVHSNILKGGSVVFERMLESGMKESEDKIIEIEDVDSIIFEAFLEYIYTAQVELNLESMDKAFGLVRVADKYGIDELKAVCYKFIFQHMSFNNAGEIAVLAYQHNAGKKLRSEVINFCQANWSQLTKLSSFEECVSGNPLAFLKPMKHEK